MPPRRSSSARQSGGAIVLSVVPTSLNREPSPSSSDGSASPREVDRLRHDPHTWFAKLEQMCGSRVHVSFLREVRTAAETLPQPFGKPSSSPAPVPANELQRMRQQLDSMRRVEAFLEVSGGHTVKSPHKCYTFAEAIESAAHRYLLKYATELIGESDSDVEPDDVMRSASSPALSTSSGSSAPTTPRHRVHTKKLVLSTESPLPQSVIKPRN